MRKASGHRARPVNRRGQTAALYTIEADIRGSPPERRQATRLSGKTRLAEAICYTRRP